jgi:DNA repair exonuclease SbcCD ATPase subunit
MNGILEVLRTRMVARRETNAETLMAAARRIAAGETVDPSAVESALVAERSTVEDFAAMCELARRRQAWHATRDKGPAAIIQRDKLTTELEAERQRFEAARLAWVAASDKLNAKLTAAINTVSASNDAVENLTNPKHLPGPLGDKLAAALDAHTAALDAAESARRTLRDARDRVKSEDEWCTHKATYNNERYSTLADHQAALARWQRRLPELETAVKEADAAVATAEKALAELRAAALKL